MKKIIQDAKTFTQEKELYVTPECTIISMMEEGFFCNSVRPNPYTSTEDGWGNDPDTDLGDEDIDIDI